MTKQKGNITILLILIAIILIGTGYLIINKNASAPTVPVQNSVPTHSPKSDEEIKKVFKSETMKFSIEASQLFQIEEKINTLKLTNKNGAITINRTGTNFDSLQEYIDNLVKENSLVFIEKELLIINSLDALKAKVNQGKLYYFYAENTVYTLFTKTESLYSDLDQIAQ